MKISVDVMVNLNVDAVIDRVNKATSESLKDVTIDIAADAIKGSPKLTGNNARSIQYEIGERESRIFWY